MHTATTSSSPAGDDPTPHPGVDGDSHRKSDLTRLVAELSQLEAVMSSVLPVVRHSQGVYVVNPAYTELAERQHDLLDRLSRRGLNFLPSQAPGSARSVVEWPPARRQEGTSSGGRLADPAVRIAHLRQSVSSRALIGQAQGILMERHGLSAEQALARLRELSHASHRRMHAVAQQVVHSGRDYELARRDCDDDSSHG